MYWILKAIFLISLLYLKTTYLLSLIFFFLFSFFWIITCYFFFLPLFFLIVVCWFSFFSFYQEWTTSFCLKCFGNKLMLCVPEDSLPWVSHQRPTVGLQCRQKFYYYFRLLFYYFIILLFFIIKFILWYFSI